MAKRTSRKRAAAGPSQREGAPPIIEDAKLPRMGEGPAVRPGRRAIMPENPPADSGKRNRMRPFRGSGAERSGRPPARGFSDQEPRRRRPATADAEGYLRLRVQVQADERKLSLAGAKVVAGPLTQTEVLHPGLAYEVVLDRRRIAQGQVQDAGVWRGFPDPSGRPALSGHHITVVPSYEIAVRVPLAGLSNAALRRAAVTLYRWSGSPALAAGDRPLRASLGRRVETVGTLSGIRLDALPKRDQDEVKAALQRR